MHPLRCSAIPCPSPKAGTHLLYLTASPPCSSPSPLPPFLPRCSVSSRRRGPIPLRYSPPTCHSEQRRGISLPGLASPRSAIRPLPKLPSPCSIAPGKTIPPVPPPSVILTKAGTHATPSFRLPCPREGGDPSPSVIPPPVSSRRRGPIPFRHSASRVLAKAGTHPTPSFRLPCPREGGDPSHSVPPPHVLAKAGTHPPVVPPPVSSRRRGPIPTPLFVIPGLASPPVSSRRRGPIPFRHSSSRVLAKAGTHPLPLFPPIAPLPQSPLISPTFTKKRIRISKSVNFRHKIIKNCPYSITKSNQLQAQTLESKSSKQLFVFKKQPPSNVILNEPKNLTPEPLRLVSSQLPIERPYRIMTTLVVLLLLKRSRHGNWQG